MTYTEQIAERILSCNPTKKLEDIADRLGVSFAWLIGGTLNESLELAT